MLHVVPSPARMLLGQCGMTVQYHRIVRLYMNTPYTVYLNILKWPQKQFINATSKGAIRKNWPHVELILKTNMGQYIT